MWQPPCILLGQSWKWAPSTVSLIELPLLFTFLQACECWEAKRFLPTVLEAQRQGTSTTKEIGAGCLGLPDPDIILTLIHTTSKPCCKPCTQGICT